jgi:RimJ/RimL family protein N-acetyltransferase
MSISEKTVTTFTTKTGQEAVIRYAELGDAEDLTHFINTFSLEDGFTRFAGEQLSLEEEKEYIQSEVNAMEAGDAVKLFCYVDKKLAGVCDVHRDNSLLTRKLHTGIFGVIIGQEFRGQGIGERLMSATIAEASKHISGLRLIKLDCFSVNAPALSLYQKLGFQEVGRLPNALSYKNGYVDEVIMVREVV